jgi:chorismate lyase/3-hydroxybenzoate synthase
LDKTPVFEVWTSQLEVCHWYDGNASFSFNNQILLGALSVQEANNTGTTLEELSYLIYKKAFQYSKDMGYPHLLRAWNYIPRINKEERGLERYKRFCMGRHAAFSENYTNIKSVVPAGTAIGTAAGPLQVIFLCSTTPGKNIENPRQTSAYDYPIQYGPVSPSFSRATLYLCDMGAKLFIAGTASIVGHSSCHLGKSSKQARETVKNILALIQRTKVEEKLLQSINSEKGVFKVYVRQRSDLKEIMDELKEHLRENHKVIFLGGDICRKELLIEIEGILTYGY